MPRAEFKPLWTIKLINRMDQINPQPNPNVQSKSPSCGFKTLQLTAQGQPGVSWALPTDRFSQLAHHQLPFSTHHPQANFNPGAPVVFYPVFCMVPFQVPPQCTNGNFWLKTDQPVPSLPMAKSPISQLFGSTPPRQDAKLTQQTGSNDIQVPELIDYNPSEDGSVIWSDEAQQALQRPPQPSFRPLNYRQEAVVDVERDRNQHPFMPVFSNSFSLGANTDLQHQTASEPQGRPAGALLSESPSEADQRSNEEDLMIAAFGKEPLLTKDDILNINLPRGFLQHDHHAVRMVT